MPLPPDGVTMDNSHRGSTDESGDVRRVHFGSPSGNETFVCGRSHHDKASLDLLIPCHTSSPPRLRSGDYNADGSVADSVGDATNESGHDAADNASDDAADEHANASSAILADGVAAAVLAEDAADDDARSVTPTLCFRSTSCPPALLRCSASSPTTYLRFRR